MTATLVETLTWLLTAVPAAPIAPAPEAAGVSENLQVQSVWDFITKGGIMMIPIGLCSLVALTVVAERLTSLRRRRVIPASFLPGLNQYMDGARPDTKAAVAYCRDDASAIANVFAAGLKRVGGPLEIVERHIQDAGAREAFKLRKHLRVLSVIAAVSPLLGLLGTIFGMITAFQTVAMSADALGRTELLAGGIYEAMITTAAGLVVAIPALICYHWLSARVQRLVMDIDETTVDFVESLSPGGAPAVGASPARTDRDRTAPPDGRTPPASPPREARENRPMIDPGEQEGPAQIELAPIIDMVFLLLIFFLVATTFHQTEREMQIALPHAASAGPISTALREIVVNVNQEGGIIVSGRPMEPADLTALVMEAVEANPDQKVTVRGDHRTAYANIMRVLDICKSAGIQEPYLDTIAAGGAAPDDA